MPAVNFKVSWPDGIEAEYYSPSTVIYQHFQAGELLSQAAFAQRVDSALNQASERVKARFGYYCSAAREEQQKIHERLRQLRIAGIEGEIRIVGFTE